MYSRELNSPLARRKPFFTPPSWDSFFILHFFFSPVNLLAVSAYFRGDLSAGRNGAVGVGSLFFLFVISMNFSLSFPSRVFSEETIPPPKCYTYEYPKHSPVSSLPFLTANQECYLERKLFFSVLVRITLAFEILPLSPFSSFCAIILEPPQIQNQRSIQVSQ